MARPSNRDDRRRDIARGYLRALARHGLGGATIARVADEAGFVPGLVHHHFRDKSDLAQAALRQLFDTHRARVRARCRRGETPLQAFIDATVALDADPDAVAARAWVGLLAEAVRDATLNESMRQHIDRELQSLEAMGLAPRDAAAALAFVVGALIVGAFAPARARGFAAPALRQWLARVPRRE
jgi:TetR/AcrR family transcriptional repressor of bet genes